MAAWEVSAVGLRGVVQACDASNVELSAYMRGGLQEIAEMVAKDVRVRYAPFSAVGAEGVRAKVTRPGNAIVAQTLRKSRSAMRRRKNFGGLMMRHAFLPAIEANREKVDASIAVLVDGIAQRHWEGAA